MIIYTHQKSKKQRPNAKQRQLAVEWELIKLKHESTTKTHASAKKVGNYIFSQNYVRKTQQYPSHVTSLPGVTTKPLEEKRYTGDKIIGIGTLHKSNAVPIFSQEEAKDQATMRR